MNKVWYPWQRVIRTAAQTLITLGAVLATITVVAPQVIDAIADVLPGPVVVWLTGAVATIAALSGALSRLMLVPWVNEFLQKWGMGTAPAGAIVVEDADGTQTPSTRRELRKQWESR